MLETKFYQENRKKLSEYMVDNSFYFVHSGSELESTYDECFLFEPYRNFLYSNTKGNYVYRCNI